MCAPNTKRTTACKCSDLQTSTRGRRGCSETKRTPGTFAWLYGRSKTQADSHSHSLSFGTLQPNSGLISTLMSEKWRSPVLRNAGRRGQGGTECARCFGPLERQ